MVFTADHRGHCHLGDRVLAVVWVYATRSKSQA